jgi:hypothetical protein
MSAPFYTRLKAYYADVGKVLRGEADAASIFPNPTDIGGSRERIYAEFLRQHSPSKCNVLFGGFLFDESGAESKQVDVIVTTDTCPQFNFHNQQGDGKTFACVEGTLACASIKSFLDKAQLEDSLANLASIPPTGPLQGRVLPLLNISNYEDWPFKIVYASNALAADTILGHLHSYYADHAHILESRKPNLIHVAGKYLIFRSQGAETLDGMRQLKKGEFVILGGSPDVQAITWTIDGIQARALAAAFIIFRYNFLINKVHE